MPHPTDDPHIGTLSEKSLHAALKAWYARPGDQIEVKVHDFVIDIVRGGSRRAPGLPRRATLIEIQTGNFSAIRRKLAALLTANHRVHLLHPIAQEKWIVRQSADGELIGRRKSPKRGRVEDLFYELVRIPQLITHPDFTIEVLLTREEEILRDDGKGSWRRKRWSVHDRRLLDVVDQVTFASLTNFRALLPATLPQPFTNRELAASLHCRLSLAQKVSYTLRKIGGIAVVGRRGNALLYENSLKTSG